MKKLGIAIFSLLAGFSAVTFAQTASKSNFDLSYVDLNFCNSQNQLHLQTTAGTQTGFCFTLNNLSNTTGVINLQLVDGEMSVGEHPVKACKTGTGGFFSKFVSLSGITSNKIILPPNTGIVQWATANIPAEFIGMLNGCVTFTVDNGSSDASGAMFQIVNRKANIMDIVVSGAYVNMFGFMNIKTYSGDKRVKDDQEKIISSDAAAIVTQLQDKNKLVIGLKNTGFINEEYAIEGVISNSYFGQTLYSKKISLGSGVLYGQDKVVIEYPIDDLPFYKGTYTIDLEVSHKPQVMSGFSFDTIEPDTIKQSLSITIYPSLSTILYIVAPLLLLCAVIVIVIVLKKKTPSKESLKNKPTKRTF